MSLVVVDYCIACSQRFLVFVHTTRSCCSLQCFKLINIYPKPIYMSPYSLQVAKNLRHGVRRAPTPSYLAYVCMRVS
jgi:hypothetical protein